MVIDWNSVATLLVGFVSGGGIIAFIFKEAIKERLHRDSVKWNERRQLAKHILSFVSSGQNNGYERHLEKKDWDLLFKLESESEYISKTVSNNLRSFIGLWAVINSMDYDKNAVFQMDAKERVKMVIGFRNDNDQIAEDIRLEVVKWLGK